MRMSIIRSLIVFVMIASQLASTQYAIAEKIGDMEINYLDEGRRLCKDTWDKSNGHDKCAEADLNDLAYKWMMVNSVVYAIGAVFCGIECYYSWTNIQNIKAQNGNIAKIDETLGRITDVFGLPDVMDSDAMQKANKTGRKSGKSASVCKIVNYAGIGFDLAAIGHIMIRTQENNQSASDGLSQIRASAAIAVGGAMLPMVSSLGITPLSGVSSASNMGGDADANKCLGMKGVDNSCCTAGMDGIFAAARGIDAFAARKNRNEAFRSKAEDFYQEAALAQTKQTEEAKRAITAASKSADSSASSSQSAKEGKVTIAENKLSPEGSIAEQARELAAMATLSDKKVFAEFEKTTGKPITDVFEKLLSSSDGNAVMAVAAATSGVLESNGANALASFASTAKAQGEKNRQAINALAPESPNVPSAAKFASSSSGSRSTASAGDAMPDFGALLGGLLPKKPGEKDKSPQGPTFSAPVAAHANSEGFHSESKSIFEIVGTRYQLVSKRFLEGPGLVEQGQPNLIPKNMYLSK